MVQTFMSRGMDLATARKRACAALFGMVQRQAAMMSYIDVFFLLAVMFLLMLPLILIMKRPEHAHGAGAMGH